MVVVGVLMMAWHRKSWTLQQDDPGFNQWDLKRLKSRYRRRMQTSGMIAVMGVMLGVGDVLIWQQGPVVATVYWIGVIALGGWLLLLGLLPEVIGLLPPTRMLAVVGSIVPVIRSPVTWHSGYSEFPNPRRPCSCSWA